MNIKYKTPLLCNVIFELKCDSTIWKTTYVGQFYEKLKKEYPNTEDITTISPELTKDNKGDIFYNIKQQKETLFKSIENNLVIAIGNGRFAITKGRPYEGWKILRPKIKKGLDCYNSIVSPKKISRIGLRYINKITIPSTSKIISAKDYFNYYPVYNDIPKEDIQFDLRTTVQYGKDALNICLFFIKEDKEKFFTLDLDYYSQNFNREPNTWHTWLNNAHKYVEDTFEKIITDKTRSILNA